MTMRRDTVSVLAAALTMTLAPTAGWACGACIEDKVAATYDHAVVKRATANRQQVVFVAVEGPVVADTLRARIARTKVSGVVPGTLRTSSDPPAFSFALDATEEPTHAVAGFRKALGDSRVRLSLMRIVRDGKMLEP
jgi:hypothetical protein